MSSIILSICYRLCCALGVSRPCTPANLHGMCMHGSVRATAKHGTLIGSLWLSSKSLWCTCCHMNFVLAHAALLQHSCSPPSRGGTRRQVAAALKRTIHVSSKAYHAVEKADGSSTQQTNGEQCIESRAKLRPWTSANEAQCVSSIYCVSQ